MCIEFLIDRQFTIENKIIDISWFRFNAKRLLQQQQENKMRKGQRHRKKKLSALEKKRITQNIMRRMA